MTAASQPVRDDVLSTLGVADGAESVFRVDANGALWVQFAGGISAAIDSITAVGDVAAGAGDSGKPVKVGAVYNATAPTLTDGDRGDLQLTVGGNLRTTLWQRDGTGAGQSMTANNATDGAAGGAYLPVAEAVYAGTAGLFQRTRTPYIFKSLSAVVVTSETTIWTPTAGRKFRLMGFALSQGVATGAVTLKDGTGGSTIFTIPQHTAGVALVVDLGNGILSGTADAPLTATGVATETLTGTVWGTEET